MCICGSLGTQFLHCKSCLYCLYYVYCLHCLHSLHCLLPTPRAHSEITQRSLRSLSENTQRSLREITQMTPCKNWWNFWQLRTSAWPFNKEWQGTAFAILAMFQIGNLSWLKKRLVGRWYDCIFCTLSPWWTEWLVLTGVMIEALSRICVCNSIFICVLISICICICTCKNYCPRQGWHNLRLVLISRFDPKSCPQSAYVHIFATFSTKCWKLGLF